MEDGQPAQSGSAPAAAGNALAGFGDTALARLQQVHQAREEALAACRVAIRACGLSIRAVHRLQPDTARQRAAEAEEALRRAQQALAPHPTLAAAGFLHDAEKEYAEARLTAALVAATPVPGPDELQVRLPGWLNGLAEAASELRRSLLDRLRGGDLAKASQLLSAMEEVYDLLVTIEFPDAITGGLRRTTDALRAVLERSRSDVTTTVLQARLQQALEAAGAAVPEEVEPPAS